LGNSAFAEQAETFLRRNVGEASRANNGHKGNTEIHFARRIADFCGSGRNILAAIAWVLGVCLTSKPW